MLVTQSQLWLISYCREIHQCFEELSSDSDCRVVLLTGAGKNFSAGLDLVDFAQDFFSGTSSDDHVDVARRTLNLKKLVKSMQNSITTLEKVGYGCFIVFLSYPPPPSPTTHLPHPNFKW